MLFLGEMDCGVSHGDIGALGGESERNQNLDRTVKISLDHVKQISYLMDAGHGRLRRVRRRPYRLFAVVQLCYDSES